MNWDQARKLLRLEGRQAAEARAEVGEEHRALHVETPSRADPDAAGPSRIDTSRIDTSHADSGRARLGRVDATHSEPQPAQRNRRASSLCIASG